MLRKQMSVFARLTWNNILLILTSYKIISFIRESLDFSLSIWMINLKKSIVLLISKIRDNQWKQRSLGSKSKIKIITVRTGIENHLVFGGTVSGLVSQWVVAYLYIIFFDLLVCFALSFSLLFNFLYLLFLSHFYSFIFLFFSYADPSLHTRSL